MYHKLKLFTLFVLFILVGCTNFSQTPEPTPFSRTPEPTPIPTFSLEKQYAVGMSKALLMIEKHKNGPEKNWYALLPKHIGHNMAIIGVENSNATYETLLDAMISAIDYRGLYDLYISDKDNFNEFKTLSDASQAVFDSAFDIQVALGGIEVPTSMAVPHQEIESCVEKISSYHSLIIKIFTGIIPTEADITKAEENSCDKMDLSLRKIQQYIDGQSANSGV